MSKQLLVNNANAVPAAAAGTTSPADVAEGTIAAFDADNFAGGTLDLTALATAENIVFVQGAGAEDDPIMSQVFKVSDITPERLNERAYVAPVAQVTTITPATGSGVAYVRVVRVDTGFKPFERITVETKIDDKTLPQIAQDLADKINKARPNFVTASVDTNDLVITGDIGVSFETQTDEEAEGWTIAATAPNFGSGTYAQLKNIEEVAYGGNYTNRIYLPVAPPSYVQNTNYDLFTIRIPTNTTPNISSANKYKDLILAVHNVASGIDLPVFFGHEEAVV